MNYMQEIVIDSGNDRNFLEREGHPDEPDTKTETIDDTIEVIDKM